MLSPQADLLAAKQMLIDLKLQKEDLIRSNYLTYFKPNPGGQTEFFEKSDCYIRAVFSGNRFGKSTAGTVEDASWLLGERPFYPQDHPCRYLGIPKEDVKGIVVVHNCSKVKSVFTQEGNPAVSNRVGKMFIYIPPNKITSTRKNEKGVITEIAVENFVHGRIRKGHITFVTVEAFKRNEMVVHSDDYDFVHIDEPCPKGLWTGLARGLVDRGGKAWWLMTPRSEPWMYHEFLQKEEEDPKQYWSYQGSIHENKTLSAKNKERFLRELDESERACAENGIPIALSNTILYTFKNVPSPDGHILQGTPSGWTDPITPPSSYMICVAVDTHPQTPHATLMVAVSPTGDVYVYNERFEKSHIAGDDLTESGKKSICRWLKDRPEFNRCAYLLLEPAAWNSDQDTKISYADKFFSDGLQPVKGSKKRTDIINLMVDAFRNKKRKIYVLAHCTVFIREAISWYYDKENKPKDENDHMMENFGRLLFFDDFKYHNVWEPPAPIKESDPYDLDLNNNFSYSENINYNLI